MPMSNKVPAIGFQLWLNLKLADKYGNADYQEFKKENIPTFEEAGIKAKVVVGEYKNTNSIIKTKTPSEFIDFSVEKNQTMVKKVKKGWNSFIVVFEGGIHVQGSFVEETTALFFEIAVEESEILFKTEEKNCRFLFISGFYYREFRRIFNFNF